MHDCIQKSTGFARALLKTAAKNYRHHIVYMVYVIRRGLKLHGTLSVEWGVLKYLKQSMVLAILMDDRVHALELKIFSSCYDVLMLQRYKCQSYLSRRSTRLQRTPGLRKNRK